MNLSFVYILWWNIMIADVLLMHNSKCQIHVFVKSRTNLYNYIFWLRETNKSDFILLIKILLSVQLWRCTWHKSDNDNVSVVLWIDINPWTSLFVIWTLIISSTKWTGQRQGTRWSLVWAIFFYFHSYFFAKRLYRPALIDWLMVATERWLSWKLKLNYIHFRSTRCL